MALAVSESVPPNHVEKLMPLPPGINFVTKASYLALKVD